MKFGFRTPNIKKSIKARTTGRVKRAVKKSINPVYGKKGIGYIKNPERAIKNSIYHKTTIDSTKEIKKTTDKIIKSTNEKKDISAAKVGLGIYTCGLSLLFTGIHKNKKDKK